VCTFWPENSTLACKAAVILLCSKVYRFSLKKVRSGANSRIFAHWRTILLKNPYVYVHTKQSNDLPAPLQKPFGADVEQNSHICQGIRQKGMFLTRSLTDCLKTIKDPSNHK
jgi:hypothetical protein